MNILMSRIKSAILILAIVATTVYALDKIPVGNPNGISVFSGDVEITSGKKLVVDKIETTTGTTPVG